MTFYHVCLKVRFPDGEKEIDNNCISFNFVAHQNHSIHHGSSMLNGQFVLKRWEAIIMLSNDVQSYLMMSSMQWKYDLNDTRKTVC